MHLALARLQAATTTNQRTCRLVALRALPSPASHHLVTNYVEASIIDGGRAKARGPNAAASGELLDARAPHPGVEFAVDDDCV